MNKRFTPQSEPIPGSNQIANNAGGFAWAVDDWKRLERFLILGGEGGTYYVSEKKLTKDNAEAVLRCIKADGPRTVATIRTISHEGRAPKNDPALFALAMCAAFGDAATKTAALGELPNVARIGTHLYHFAEFVQGMRGWGRSLRRAIGDWYVQSDAAELAYDVVKYRQRDGWTHRDLLRLSHPKAVGDMQKVLHYAVKGEATEGIPKIIEGFQAAQASESAEVTAKLISEYGLTWEMVKPEHLDGVVVWEALLPHMPMNAMVRNLAKMTSIGLVKPMSEASALIVKRLGNQEEIQKSRLHPLNILLAAKTYSSGKGLKGSLTWNAVPQVVDALDSAFDMAFVNAPVTGKRYMLGVDVSGSMSSDLPGKPIRCCEGSAALALFIARKEAQYAVMGFSDEFVDLGITAKDTIQSASRKALMNNFGGTDASIAMRYALNDRIGVDVFVIITDSETWAGRSHPAQVLQEYREKMGIPAKLVVIGMTATEISIADPSDGGMLDMVGFDTAIPTVLADFAVH